MLKLAKAIPLSALLAFALAGVFGAGGGPPKILAVHQIEIADIAFYWSWPIFLAGTLLAWAILWMMD